MAEGTGVRITVLCDNVVGFPVGVGEHGFAALLELPGETLLFDTGSGRGIVGNALAFGKDLRSVGSIAISHGHYDHTEGLPQVLALRGEVAVHGHPEMFQTRIGEKTVAGRRVRRDIGIPYRREHLELLGARFRLERGFREVAPGTFLTGEVPRRTPFETADPDLQLPDGDGFRPDPVLDDQSVVVRTARGLVVVFGCAHAGMINTLHHARERTGDERIRAVLGGTHLGFFDDERREAALRALRALDPGVVAVSHCTGLPAALSLRQEFAERFAFAHVGSEFVFD